MEHLNAKPQNAYECIPTGKIIATPTSYQRC